METMCSDPDYGPRVCGEATSDPTKPDPSPEAADDFGQCQDPNACGGDPVNFTTGNVYEQKADLYLPGRGMPLRFERTYNNLDTREGPLGYGWTHNFDTSLEENADGSATLRDPEGSHLVFAKNPDGTYSAPKSVHDELTKNADGSLKLRKKDGVEWIFGTDGKLRKIRDPNGNAIDLAYDAGGRLTKLVDTAGRETTLSPTTLKGASRPSRIPRTARFATNTTLSTTLSR